MVSKKINKFNQDFLAVELEPITQKNKRFFIAKIPAKDVLALYTVEPAQYDMEKQAVFAASFSDDKTYYDYLIDEDRKRADNKEFQRKESTRRVREIAKFLNEEEYSLFPNSIIVTCELINGVFNIDATTKFADLTTKGIDKEQIKNISFLEEISGKYTLYIPYVKSSILVIDGQHRLRGLEEADKNILNNYELLLTFVIDYDRTVLAELFYTINYTQKSVNKSLLYHLSGEFSRELNAVTFLHEGIKILNELKGSPFQQRIKMLGVIPENISEEDKAKMTISQAFLIDYLLPTISEQAKRSIHPPIFLYYYKRKELQIEIIRFVNKYFKAVEKLLGTQWNKPAESVISKTVSVGALIKVLHFLFIKMFFKEYKSNYLEIKNITVDTLQQKIKGLEKIDFGINGDYGKEGSAGGLNKLKKEMIKKIEYFEAVDYDKFLEKFKTDYLTRFRKTL